MEGVPGHFSFRKRSPATIVPVKPIQPTSVQFLKKDKGFFSISRPGDLVLISDPINADLLDTDTYEFPSYFKFFLNVMFLLCMMPFRIKRNKVGQGQSKNYVLVVHKNILQMIIVAAIHSLLMAFSLAVLTNLMSAHLRKKPNNLFYIIIYFAIVGFLAAFSHSAWRKHDSYRNMMTNFKKPEKGFFCKMLFVLIMVSVIPIAQQFVKFTLSVIDIVRDETILHQQLRIELKKMWLGGLIKGNETQASITEPLVFDIGSISMACNEVLDFYRTLVEIVVFIAALSVREITKKYWKIFDKVPIKSLHQMSDLYLKMERQIGFINDCNGPVVLAWFGLATSFFVDTFFRMFSETRHALKLVDFLSILNYTAALIAACDARNMALKCKATLLERGSSQNDYRWTPAFVAYLELSEDDVGVRGSDFFVISYEFVGKMVGMLATFLLIMLQLNLELMEKPDDVLFHQTQYFNR